MEVTMSFRVYLGLEGLSNLASLESYKITSVVPVIALLTKSPQTWTDDVRAARGL